jgi:hypothetical protein
MLLSPLYPPIMKAIQWKLSKLNLGTNFCILDKSHP